MGKRTFFVSPSGRDLNSGLSPAQAWKTLAKVSATELVGGDTVLFEAGKTFRGKLRLKGTVDSAERPVTIGSTPGERAIIKSSGTAIEATSVGLVVRDLILRGNAKVRAEEGSGILLRSATNGLFGVQLESLDISGFGSSGITLTSDAAKGGGFQSAVISNCRCHDNFGHGIEVTGNHAPGYPHSNLLIEDCECSRNSSGSGIVVSGVEGGRIERCSAFDNSGPGGGVGIWAWRSKDVVVHECIAARTRSLEGDGGGFDLDGGCVECRIEECLSYENDGPGFMHCDYPSAPPTRCNSFVGCLSVNDGRKPKGDNVGFGFVTWGSGLDDCRIESCRAIVTEAALGSNAQAIFFVAYVRGAQAEGDVLHVKGCSFVDNRAFVLAPGYRMVDLGEVSPNTVVRDSGGRYWARGFQGPINEGEAEISHVQEEQVLELLRKVGSLRAVNIADFFAAAMNL